ncbi:hypothetical protein XENTR_v10013326 [Xenopus tropicalis]|nr:hypothetical protein XENTR_v10013326 [Xenopus tropicalis]
MVICCPSAGKLCSMLLDISYRVQIHQGQNILIWLQSLSNSSFRTWAYCLLEDYAPQAEENMTVGRHSYPALFVLK